ncbi:MAG: 2,3-bisphosphoglycerate-independent phosphoglycerate mutase [Brumimicrobium sp.]|nr:2,3-bisphosphoglycerate-independent phosphoglycerate mutase [Brumimicrobium sp.]
MENRKVGLIILDGWGLGDKSASDAVYNAQTPVMDSLMNTFPTAKLLTSGEEVGLPAGQMGNSEVGHLNIGAGRIVYQELTRINKAIKEGEFFEIPVLKETFKEAAEKNKKVHFIGLVSDGGVHSSQNHLHALCDMAKEYNLKKVFIHGFSDGRDCDPKSGIGFFKLLERHIEGSEIQLASIVGRYYAMDRDNRWERVKKAYDLLVHREGKKFTDCNDAFKHWYAENITDEFIEPTVIETDADARIEQDDIVICFNFRTDRPREIVAALSQKSFPELNMEPLSLNFLTMTEYDETFRGIKIIFEKDNLQDTLGEVLQSSNKTQVRIAETEKYPHVTFFFSGGRENPFKNEKRILVDSPKVATYDLQPEMSAPEVTKKIVEEIKNNQPDFFCLNFANPDMVGHTGVYKAIIKAVETVDNCLGKVVIAAREKGYELIIIADHGNADMAVNEDGSPNTAHSLNPVPVVFVTEDSSVKLSEGILADVAPTILERLLIEKPEAMTGKSLIG